MLRAGLYIGVFKCMVAYGRRASPIRPVMVTLPCYEYLSAMFYTYALVHNAIACGY
jgi:hypothetical protein